MRYEAALTHSYTLSLHDALPIWALTNLSQAQRCFGLARDFDALPFRADSRINEIIEKIASEHAGPGMDRLDAVRVLDRKSTRLKSSHTVNSYAVFCLKKKNSTVA